MTSPHDMVAIKSERRPTWVRWRIVIILMGFAGLTHFHRQSLPSVVERVMHDCQLSETDMGWIYSAFLSGYVAFMIVGGWIADRWGGTRALTISGLGTAAMVTATGICGYAWAGLGLASFLLVRCCLGVFTTPLFPAAGRVVAAWSPFRTRAWANGLVLGATTIGVSSAPIAFGALSDQIGWRDAFATMGVITLLLTVVWAWYGRNRPAEHPAVNAEERALFGKPSKDGVPGRASVGEWLWNRDLLLLTLNYAAVGYYEYTLFYWMKYYFHEVLHYPEQTSRYFTAIVTFAMVFAMPLGGILSDALVRRWGYRAGRASVPIVGMLSSAGLLLAATRAEGQLAVVSLFFLSHAAIGLCEAPTWVAGLELGGENCGTSAAIVNTGGNLGGLLAPVVTIYVAGNYGWTAGYLVASLACLVGVVLWFGIRLKEPHQGRI